jgi:hypothetical protein
MNMESEGNTERNKLEITETQSGSISVSQELSESTKRNLAEAAFAGMRGGRLSDAQVDRFFQIPEDEVGDWEFAVFMLPSKRNSPDEIERMLEKEGFEPAGLGHLDAFKNQNEAPEDKIIIATRNILDYQGGLGDAKSAFPTYSTQYGNKADFWEILDVVPGGDRGLLVLGVKKA